MASEDREKPTPSRSVLVWETAKKMIPSTENTLGRLADERGILDKSNRGRLMVLLALWEFKLPQDDPLADRLVRFVDLPIKELQSRTGEFAYQTKKGIVSGYIMSQLWDRDRPEVMQRIQPLSGPKGLFDMTVPELRWQIVDRRIPLDGGWEVQWRGPLVAHLLIADALADDLRHNADAYRILLPEVLDIVAMNNWGLYACVERRKMRSVSGGMSREELARLIVRDMKAKCSILPRSTDKHVQAGEPVVPSRSGRLADIPTEVPPKRKLPWQEKRTKKVARYVIDSDEDRPRRVALTAVPPRQTLTRGSSTAQPRYVPDKQPDSIGTPATSTVPTGSDKLQPGVSVKQPGMGTPATTLVPFGSDQNLPDNTPEDVPRAKRRTLPAYWKTGIEPPQPKEEPREGVFSWTPTQLWEELDKRGIPHLVDGKKSREKARLVSRLLLDDEGVFPGTVMYDKVLPILEGNLGRRYQDMVAWAWREYWVPCTGLPYDNREPVAKATIQKIIQKMEGSV